MKHLFFILIFLFIINYSYSQSLEEKSVFLEQLIEQISEETDEELDFSELYESLEYYYKHPININNCRKEDLEELHFLNSFQIEKLFQHIEKNGKLLSYLELQSVRGFDMQTIENLRSFVKIKPTISKERLFDNISQYILIRNQDYLQEQKGYIEDENGKKYYLGSANRSYFKYRLNNRYLQAGITAEKDMGETFLDEHQTYGFDFYSAHLLIKNVGKIESIIIGDYQLQIGQGISMYSGMGFGKSSEVIDIQKSGNLIKAHTSASENLFFRGIATKINLIENMDLIGFYSNNKVDANIVDTLENNEVVYSSLQSSGLHRTENELEDKNAIIEQNMGFHFNYKIRGFNIGATFIQSNINGNYDKNILTYNQFDINKSDNQIIGTDYQYLLKNMNFFGEISRSKNGGLAHLNGVLIGLDKTLSASFMYRNYDRDFQNKYGNSFSETKTQNEKGIYSGLEFRPNLNWKFRAYTDFYQFPWLKYNTDVPSNGRDIFVQADYKINRKTNIYLRYKTENKEENYTIENSNLTEIINRKKQNIRLNSVFNEEDNWIFKNRIEFTNISIDEHLEKGYLLYQDVKYKPLFSKFNFTFRYLLFNTESYESRIYTYENDVLYGYSIPSFYGSGKKVYLLLKYNIIKNTDLWIKFSHTIYDDKEFIKSGWEEIEGNKLTEIKIQLRLKF